jgi:hypothetical protein
MTRKNQVFNANVMMWETMTSNVINQSIDVIVKFSAIVKIYKYRRLHKG